MEDMRYLEPSTVTEAVAFLAEHRGEAQLVAGATDLLMDMRMKGLAPRYLVNINKLSDLRYVREENGSLAIGALTRMRDLETSDLIRERYPALAEAAAQVGSIQIRNLATVGGNIAHATPSAEMAPPLLALDARVTLVGPGGERAVPLAEFFTGPGTTVREADEILTEIRVPNPLPGTGMAYVRHCIRGALDIAIACVGCYVRLTDGVVQEARVALGAVAPTPIRAPEAEEALRGKAMDDTSVTEAAQLAADASKPISDVRASAEYRREMVKVLTRRALRLAAERAGA